MAPNLRGVELGIPYEWGGSNQWTAVDCSGLVCDVLDVPRTTADGLFHDDKRFRPIAGKDPSKWQTGDLLFFYRKNGKVTHVGLWDGERNGIVHASRGRGKVVLDQPGTKEYDILMRNWAGARRARLTVNQLVGGQTR